MIDIINVEQTFGDRRILKNVNLQINKGETMVILGASGSGKSTLLKMMIGLLKPTSGKILIDGRDITKMPETERKHMGMVFQYSALFDSMNVKENIAFGLRMHTKLSEPEIDQAVKEKLHLVGLDGTEELMPSNLSGGMKKRIGLARAIVLEPEIILYDEPTAGLDPIRSTDISLLIKNMQEKLHVTSVVVTHDLKSAELIADRMAFLYEGSFLEIGKPSALYQSKDPRIKQFMNGLPSSPDIEKEGDE